MPDGERESDPQSASYACFAALQALVIVLSERGRIERDDLREALEEAADSERTRAADSGAMVHQEAANLLDQLVRDSYATSR